MQESCTFILYIHLDNVKKKKEKENPLFVVPNHPQCKRIDRFEQRLTRAVARRWLVNNEVSFTVNFSWSNPKGGLARHSCYILCHWALRDFHGGRGGGPSRPVTTVYRLLPLVWRRRLCHLPSLLFLSSPRKPFLISLLFATPLLFAPRRRFLLQPNFLWCRWSTHETRCLQFPFDSEEKLAVRDNRGYYRYFWIIGESR